MIPFSKKLTYFMLTGSLLATSCEFKSEPQKQETKSWEIDSAEVSRKKNLEEINDLIEKTKPLFKENAEIVQPMKEASELADKNPGKAISYKRTDPETGKIYWISVSKEKPGY